MNARSVQSRLTILVPALVIMSVAAAAEDTRAAASPARPKAKATHPARTGSARPDIVKAVKSAAMKDCGCGACAAKGCDPCHGKNCYFCAAKSLVAMECGCGMCSAKGCQPCGPGCDVCKFHLAPMAEGAASKKDVGAAPATTP